MITWIQTRFQTGYKILFFVVLLVIIVAFVFTIGEAPGLGRGQPRGEAVDYFGYNLRSDRDLQELYRLAGISFYIQHGRDGGERLQPYALERVAYLQTGRDLGIPTPSTAELQNFVRSLDGFRGPDGRFDGRLYSEYLDNVEAHPRMSQDDVARVFEEDFIVEKVRALLSGPGYALPQAVRRDLARQRTEWTVELASLPLADLDVDVEPDDEDLRTFYEENDFRYEVPPHKVVSYVVFESDRYLDEAEAPSEAEMREYFERNRGDFSLPEEEIPEADEQSDSDDEAGDAEPREVTFDDVKDQVEAVLKRRAARRLAEQAASDFTFALFEGGFEMNSDELAAKIDEWELHRETLVPYPEGERPAIIRDSRPLNEDRFYSDPQSLGDNMIVILLDDIHPAYIPPFEDVRDRVAADYREEETRRLRAERGNRIHETLVAKLGEEVGFEEAAAEEGLAVRSFEPFTLQSPPGDLSRSVLGRLQELRPGQVSRMIQENDTAYFLYIRDREVPEIDETHEDFITRLEQTRSFSANFTGQFAIQEIQQRAMPRTTQPAR